MGCSKRRKGIEFIIVVVLLAFLLIGQGVSAWAGMDRIFPTRKVTLYHGDRIIGVYTREAPLPEGSIIATDGRCAVKLDDLYLVGEDRSEFSISTTGRQRNLFIRQGTVYFKTSAMKRAFAFITPGGPISVQSIRLHAGLGDGSLKGYVAVTESRTELGVAEGGSMDVFTDDGLMTIQSGKKIILSQADMDIGLPESSEPAAKQPPKPEPGMSSGRKIGYGALGVGAIAGIAMGLGGGGGGGDSAVSPSTP